MCFISTKNKNMIMNIWHAIQEAKTPTYSKVVCIVADCGDSQLS